MRRRLTIAMILMVAASLVVAGLFTLLLTIRGARQDTRRELIGQAQALATAVRDEAAARPTARPGQSLRALLTALRAPLSLEGEAVYAIGPDGRIFDVDAPAATPTLPSGLTIGDVDPQELLEDRTVSGTKGSIVYAVAPFRADVVVAGRTVNLTEIVVLTRRPPTGLRQSGGWFLLSGAAVLALAALVADRLGRRITRPLVAAEEATRRIAAGELDAQVPVPPHGDAETASLARSINSMAVSLARARGLERQFLMSVSHDLRTPLTSIRGFAEAIADGAAPDAERAARVIASESRRLERLVQDLLQLAKLDAREFSLDLRPVDLPEVVADSGEGFRPTADELGISLTVDAGAPGSIAVEADPDRLAQVVANLVENALKYASASVRVAAAWSDGHPVVWVDDDGPGIAPADLPHVFDRLFMASRYPARQVGSGLGLAIVAELVEAMGGAVRAESPGGAGQGTRMVVTLRPGSPVTAPMPAR